MTLIGQIYAERKSCAYLYNSRDPRSLFFVAQRLSPGTQGSGVVGVADGTGVSLGAMVDVSVGRGGVSVAVGAGTVDVGEGASMVTVGVTCWVWVMPGPTVIVGDDAGAVLVGTLGTRSTWPARMTLVLRQLARINSSTDTR